MKCPICKTKMIEGECISCEKINDYVCEPDKLTAMRRYHKFDSELQAKGEV
jgi:hypothetical protein